MAQLTLVFFRPATAGLEGFVGVVNPPLETVGLLSVVPNGTSKRPLQPAKHGAKREKPLGTKQVWVF